MEKGRPLFTRLVEQSLPGIIVAAVVLYANNAVQESKISRLSQDIQEVKVSIEKIRQDLYTPLTIQNKKM